MDNWEEFECECTQYLNEKYSNSKVIFEHKGCADSTVPDIAVYKNGNLDFYVEAKMAGAQSGQFVLFPNYTTRTFDFSERNYSEQNEFTEIIISQMNDNFDYYCSAGTAGRDIDINQVIFSRWIIGNYQRKGVKFVISKDIGFVILPIEKFGEYFNISAKYRVKKSGSTSPAKKDIQSIVQELKSQYKADETWIEDGKLLVSGIGLAGLRFVLGDYTYYLSDTNGTNYEVRRLSNTNNMNVIFSISLKKDQDLRDLEAFKKSLK